MKRTMLLVYRTAYFLIAALLLDNILNTHYLGDVPTSTEILKPAFAGALCGSLILVLWFGRIRPLFFWIGISVWEILFVWYAWLSPGAPLIVMMRNKVLAGVLFAAVSAWFYSLALVRGRQRRKG